jgi:hypothetical protein
MAYVDKTYYDGTYNGTTISDTDVFAQLLNRAEDVINGYTNILLYDQTTFDALNTFQQTGVKKAVCAQIEFIYNLGGYSATNNSEDNSTGFSLSKFKIEGTKDNSKTEYQYFEGIPISPSVNMYLKNTGLLYRGIGVIE